MQSLPWLNTYKNATQTPSKWDYDTWQRRQEELHRHRLRFEYTDSEQVPREVEGEDEIDGGSI